jgi:DNA-binding MarR family transcriptional regulator
VVNTDQLPMAMLLTGLGRESTARVRRAMRPLGLGAQHFLVLRQLKVLGESSQAELADGLGIDRSNLTDVVDSLCADGLIERSRDEADRRRNVLRLSAAGKRLLRRTEGAIANAEEELLAALDAGQRQQLCPEGETRTARSD